MGGNFYYYYVIRKSCFHQLYITSGPYPLCQRLPALGSGNEQSSESFTCSNTRPECHQNTCVSKIQCFCQGSTTQSPYCFFHSLETRGKEHAHNGTTLASWFLSVTFTLRPQSEMRFYDKLFKFCSWCDTHWIYAGVSAAEPLCCLNGLPVKYNLNF